MGQYHILIVKCMPYWADISTSVKRWYLEEKNSFTLNQQLLDDLGLEKWKWTRACSIFNLFDFESDSN